ncbi:hypothetical protein OS188_10410 [Xanthomarina sp. F1114]|uniref:hypothetical protein n=1 Tax=Xanthomarina sp. F1114 TaxID=2996019 RepID=UPI00225DD25E|nr:hypothetical protein [Xanthomarina sp. F1114]MCX7548361.1 hypothetical protein [Xanthomarina sp. F1114]
MGSKRGFLLLSLLFFFVLEVFSQVGIGTTNPDASSVLDIESTDAGVLIPRIALTSSIDVTTITAPTESLLIYNTHTNLGANSVRPGFYFWNGSKWSRLNDNEEKVYGEVFIRYGSQSINVNNPIRFGSVGLYQGVIPYPSTGNTNNRHLAFQIITPGVYRVSYSISVVKRVLASVTTFGFMLRVGTGPTTTDTTEVIGSRTHEQVEYINGNANCSMTKLVHLNADDRIYVFPTISYTSVEINDESAVFNIELIQAD